MQENLNQLIIPDVSPIIISETEIKSDEENSELYSDDFPFRLPLRIKTFENETELIKFAKNCEKLLRSSLEYKDWRAYILDVLQVNTCMITNERMDEVSVEVHHHVPSLFTLMKALINKKLEAEESFSTFDICQDAIKLHFDNKVGYLVLITSMHEKIHNGYLNVPAKLIRGDFNYFIANYSKFLDDGDLEVITRRLAVEDADPSWSRGIYPGLIDPKSPEKKDN
jgi:hypothetical protein